MSESNRDYHADHGAVSHSMLEVFSRSPRLFQGRFVTQTIEPDPPTPELLLGSVVHTCVLEPERLEEDYVICEAKTRAGKLWDAAAQDAASSGRTAVLESVVHQSHRIAEAIHSCQRAQSMLAADGPVEESLRWQRGDVACKLRADKIINDERFGGWIGVVDLKTAADPSKEAFERAAASYGYHRQAAWYIDGIEATYELPAVFYWIVIGKSEPFDVCVYKASDAMLASGRAQNTALLERLEMCFTTGEWLLPEQAELTELNLPKWAQ